MIADLLDRKDRDGALDALNQMLVMLEAHFRSEERFFAITDYPHASAHKIEHRVLRHMAGHIRGAVVLLRESDFIGLSLRHFVQAMVEHIIEIDLGYRPHLAERG
jgi:hemerythrin